MDRKTGRSEALSAEMTADWLWKNAEVYSILGTGCGATSAAASGGCSPVCACGRDAALVHSLQWQCGAELCHKNVKKELTERRLRDSMT